MEYILLLYGLAAMTTSFVGIYKMDAAVQRIGQWLGVFGLVWLLFILKDM